jgi:hypothetical protein
VPIVAITTGDPGATQSTLATRINAERPKLAWDAVNGIHGLNETGRAVVTALGGEADATKNNIVKALVLATSLPEDAILLVHNAHKQFVSSLGSAAIQAVWNLRDLFKVNGRCLILLVPIGTDLPLELRSDVLIFEDPAPDDDTLREIVLKQIEAIETNEGDRLKGGKLETCRTELPMAAAAVRGTSAFQAEQLAAMSISEDGFMWDYLNSQAKKLIEQTKGLTYERGSERFADIGGMDGGKQWANQLFGGPAEPHVVVRVEELEKSLAGVHGDMSGTSQDTLQVLLSAMEDHDWDGILAYGGPGSGKSLWAKALANQFNARALRLDPNACKGSLVGQSEQNIRQAIEVIRVIGGSRVLFIGSCNKLDTIPPELQRRFRSGVWYFDTPSKEQRAAIWKLHMAHYFGDEVAGWEDVDEDELVGSDIRCIVEQAWKLNTSIADARKNVICLKQRSPEILEAARVKADGRFWDVNTGEVYRRETAKPTRTKRRAKLAAI